MSDTWAPGMTLDSIEKIAIIKAYAFYRNNKTVTAQSLGISIRTLDAKLERYEYEHIEQERRAKELADRDQAFLERQRGPKRDIEGRVVPNPREIQTEIQTTAPGIRMESTEKASSQPTVPMLEQQEVQSMLPGKATRGRPRKLG